MGIGAIEGIVFRVDVHHDIHDVMLAQHRLARGFGNVMTFGHADAWIDQNVRIHQRVVGHFAGAQFVQAAHAGCLQQRLAYRLHLFGVQAGVDQFGQGFKSQLPAHVANHNAHHRSGQQVEEGIAQQVADNAHHHYQRRGRIGAGVPGIGNQHLRAHPLGDGQHVAKHAFLGQQGNHRHRQTNWTDRLHRLWMLQARGGGNQQAHAQHRQKDAENEGGGSFYPRMTIGVLVIGMTIALTVGKQYQHVR